MSFHSPSVEDSSQRLELNALEKAAAGANHQAFALLATAINWSLYRAADLTRAIDLALTLDLVSLARTLAQQGSKLFPGETHLRDVLAVLSPPVVRGTRPAQDIHLKASQRWFKEHAPQYKGQWVAVRMGTLLASAPTLKELHEHIGTDGHTASTIVVKVV